MRAAVNANIAYGQLVPRRLFMNARELTRVHGVASRR